jgi:hypothetical protein
MGFGAQSNGGDLVEEFLSGFYLGGGRRRRRHARDAGRWKLEEDGVSSAGDPNAVRIEQRLDGRIVGGVIEFFSEVEKPEADARP